MSLIEAEGAFPLKGDVARRQGVGKSSYKTGQPNWLPCFVAGGGLEPPTSGL